MENEIFEIVVAAITLTVVILTTVLIVRKLKL
jgi:hypothetical protein